MKTINFYKKEKLNYNYNKIKIRKIKMKKNTKWLLENKINYKRIFENKGEKKLDFVIESLIENRNLSLDTNFDFNPFNF